MDPKDDPHILEALHFHLQRLSSYPPRTTLGASVEELIKTFWLMPASPPPQWKPLFAEWAEVATLWIPGLTAALVPARFVAGWSGSGSVV